MADTHEKAKDTLSENMENNLSEDEDQDQDATMNDDATTCTDYDQEFATYSPKTSNRFDVLGGISTIDDEDTGQEESYAESNNVKYPREKRVPRESTYADIVGSRDVRQERIEDPVHIEESKNKEQQSGSQERANFQ
eukprot:Seg7398.2 transcript_id=Seg7398.2/GoldUCD/mRNA.D3Y31 product="hypothetical protein" protein_id=Seg7398.2/GoldUCD/D3Y31